MDQRPGRSTAPDLAVVLKGYPRLSETFIAQELLALQRRGHRFAIWSLRKPYDPKSHPMHDEIAAPVTYLPEYLHEEPLRVLRGWRAARRLPGYPEARRVWLADLRRDPTRNRVRRWGQALVMAAELPAEITFLYAHFLHTPASVTRYAALIRRLGWGFSAHAKDIWTTPEWEIREKIADAAFGVTCTASGADYLRSHDTEGGTVDLVYHGLDLSRFPKPPDARPQRGSVSLISVGRLVEKKGYDDLLTALAHLPSELDWHFVHIGGGKLAERMRTEAENLGLASRITWQGKRDQDEVIAAMRDADLFVLPSKIAADGDRDGLPNVLMEAASQRLAIISTRVSAIPEFIEDGVHGRLVAPGEPAELARAISDLARDPVTRATYAQAAHQRLHDNFGMAAGIDLLEARLTAAMTR